MSLAQTGSYVNIGGAEAQVVLNRGRRHPIIDVIIPQTGDPPHLISQSAARYVAAKGDRTALCVSEFSTGGLLQRIRIEPYGIVQKGQHYPHTTEEASRLVRSLFDNGYPFPQFLTPRTNIVD